MKILCSECEQLFEQQAMIRINLFWYNREKIAVKQDADKIKKLWVCWVCKECYRKIKETEPDDN